MKTQHYKLLMVSFFCLFAAKCTTTEIPLEEDPGPIVVELHDGGTIFCVTIKSVAEATVATSE